MDARWSGSALPLNDKDLAVLEDAERSVESNRCGDLIVRVVDENGQPLRSTPLQYTQRQHAFRFGAHYPYHPRVYDLLQDAGINTATLWLGWKYVQPERGLYNFEYLEKVWNPSGLYQRGLRLKAHALNWFKPDWHVLPQYLLEMPTNDLPMLIYEHVSQIARRWMPYIETFEIVNEPFWVEASAIRMTLDDMVRVCSAAALAVLDAIPQAKLHVNFAEISRTTSYAVHPYDFLEALDKANVSVSGIGLQALENAYTATVPTVFYRSKGLASLLQSFRRYFKLGKTLHISALSIPSVPPPVKPPSTFKLPYGDWDETTQAQYLDAIYTLFFAQREIEEITWYCPVDGRLAYIAGGGLLRQDLSPKPAYTALRQWISRHTSRGQKLSDNEGKVLIRAYAGEYEITVGSGAQGRRFTYTIEPCTVHDYTVVLAYRP